MGLFDKIFGRDTRPAVPDVQFGRYSDAYKSEEKYDAWDRAIELFEEGKYKDSFSLFFDYLTDDDQQNVHVEQQNGTLTFRLYQGSKVITGEIGGEMIRAEAKVARATKLSIGFLRRMMEQNYLLKYSRYALDPSDNITLIFDSYLLDGSPYKMYFALKEIAVSADKQDDLLVAEFDALEPVNTGHIEPIPEREKQLKTEFLRTRIQEVLAEIDTGRLNPDQYTGGIGYLLLDLVYRLDYLISPEGRLMEAFERIHRTYFASDDKSPIAKNAGVRKELEHILERSDREIRAELYRTRNSFGITTPGTHDKLIEFIDGELHNMDWYAENRHYTVALAIPGYIAGYGLFNYAFQPPLQELLHLYFHIMEPDFFKMLGFERVYFNKKEGNFDKRGLRKALSEIESRHKERFPKLEIDARQLNLQSPHGFAKSYFLMLRALDLTRKT